MYNNKYNIYQKMLESNLEKAINDLFQDRDLIGFSTKWANWMSKLSITTCKFCTEKHGTIVDISILESIFQINAHIKCKCVYVPMRTKIAGTATDLGESGADSFLLHFKKLPDYYINKMQARKSG